jgi:low-density lipoprotein receptor-related protein 1 (alpha-2-macroglobulin receptor)
MKKQISRVRVGQSSIVEPEILHRDRMQNPDGIAFDWVALNLYWCDKGQKTIEVSQDNGKYRKVLIKNNIDAPRGLALNPYLRAMYWTDWGIFPHIGRAGMDGSNPEIIVNGSLGWPNALTISFETNELFFGDAKEDFISVCDFDGRNRKILAHRRTSPSINHIFAIATWDDKVYFSDWESTSIEYCDKYSGKNCGTLTKLDQKAMDIKVYHPFRQQKLQTTNSTTIKKPTWEMKIEQKKKYNLLTNIKDNPCATAKCSALCLLSPNPPYYQCQCPDYFYLDKDQKSCIANCTDAQFHCKKSLRCIPFFWKCDGQADCDFYEDEPPNCPKFKCQHGEFQCDNDISTKNATCLEPIQVCNGARECADGKDEENCDLYGCFIESQFQCEKTANKSAYCISKKAR